MKRLRHNNINTKEWWDVRWQGREGFSRFWSGWRLEILSRHERILNVACGYDNLASVLGEKVIASDLSPAAVAFQRSYTPHGVVAGGTALPFPARSVECVLACHVIEHMDNPVDALFEWGRVARDCVMVLCPHDAYLNDNIEHLWRFSHEDFVHLGILVGCPVTFFDGDSREIWVQIHTQTRRA